jgi:hypothetical protein
VADDLFDGGNQSADVHQNQNGNNDIVSQLVGEGKKFKTVEDALKGKVEADAFIEQLKGENAEMRARMNGLEAIVKTIQSKPDGVDGNSPKVTTPSVDDGSLDERVARVLEQKTAEQARKANLENAVSTLRAIHGDNDKVKAAIAAKATELGMSPASLKATAEQSPAAFLRLMGAEQKQVQAPIPSRNAGGTAAAPSSSGVKNFAYYENLRKTMGSRYYDARVQNEMFKSRQELGDKFYQ